MLFLIGSANRDDRRFPDPDRFDIHRQDGPHITFGYGIHFCLGAALARLEGRVALDEVLNRFPEWEVDWERARLAPTSTVRGWETLPVTIPTEATETRSLMGSWTARSRSSPAPARAWAKASVEVFVREGATVVAGDISGAEQDTAGRGRR